MDNRLLRQTQHIPTLPDELFDVIRVPTKKQTQREHHAQTTATATPSDTLTATEQKIQDLKALCACVTIDRLNDDGV